MATKYYQVIKNLVEFQIPEIKNINSPIKELEVKTLRKLIADLRADDNKRVFIAI